MTAGPIVLTPGEPAGVGPDLAVSISRYPFSFGLVVAADPDLLRERANRCDIPLKINVFDPQHPPLSHSAGTLTVLACPLASRVEPGQPSIANAKYVLSTIDQAVDGCRTGQFSAMVTGPVHKAIINEAGYPFSGHTEYIAERCGNVFPVMMLMNRKLRVALVTTHLPLNRVPAAITAELIETVIRTVHHDLTDKFRIDSPRLLICGLNPHAGERGYLGREEIEIIEPAIAGLQREGMHLIGPVPADTAFTPEMLKQADAVISMFHDQGLPVLKSMGFGETVNITLGLPIIRTSVDHGTAFDLAGTGKANDGSLLEAIRSAATLAGLL